MEMNGETSSQWKSVSTDVLIQLLQRVSKLEAEVAILKWLSATTLGATLISLIHNIIGG